MRTMNALTRRADRMMPETVDSSAGCMAPEWQAAMLSAMGSENHDAGNR